MQIGRRTLSPKLQLFLVEKREHMKLKKPQDNIHNEGNGNAQQEGPQQPQNISADLLQRAYVEKNKD